MGRPLRSTFIVALVGLGTALAAVGGWRYARASAPVSGPIVLISVDSLRADRLPAYGYAGIRTPALDAIASDGIVFERAYAHTPQTLPSHTALLTGRLPFRTGVRDNAGFIVRPTERLLPEMLRDRGYATAGVVSSQVLRAESGIAQGFSFYDDDFTAEVSDVPGGALERDGARSALAAERWLASVGTERAFLFLHLYEPHKPYTPPERFGHHPPYDGEIAYVDEIVGRLVRYLKTHQLYDQSTIIVVADHGEGLGDHGEQEHGLLVYDEVLRVPLIIKPAAGEVAGRRVSDLVQHVDVVPTILDLARAPVPDNLDGRSLVPLLEQSGTIPVRHVYGESLYGWYHFGWSDLRTVTDGRYRYIRSPNPELFDLDEDPAARQNLAAERPDEASAFDAIIERVTTGTRVELQGETSPLERERLARLGYVGWHAGPPLWASPADPTTRVQVLERYRAAVDRAADRQWSTAITMLQQLLADEPRLASAWGQLAATALRADRPRLAAEAYNHAIAVCGCTDSHLGAAGALARLRRPEDARRHAEAALMAAGADAPSTRARAHETLARLALARGDAREARRQAALADEAEPGLPLSPYVDAVLLAADGRHEDAIALYDTAIQEISRLNQRPIAELRYQAAESLLQLGRLDQAEGHLLRELQYFPEHSRARAALATLYHRSGRHELAVRTAADLARIGQTPDANQLAARLLASFGSARQPAGRQTDALRSPDRAAAQEARAVPR